jgi:hypothetical protein
MFAARCKEQQQKESRSMIPIIVRVVGAFACGYLAAETIDRLKVKFQDKLPKVKFHNPITIEFAKAVVITDQPAS